MTMASYITSEYAHNRVEGFGIHSRVNSIVQTMPCGLAFLCVSLFDRRLHNAVGDVFIYQWIRHNPATLFVVALALYKCLQSFGVSSRSDLSYSFVVGSE